MATRQFTSEKRGLGYVIRWDGLLNGDDGTPFSDFNHTVRTVQTLGVLGAGGSIQVEGSLDGGTTYAVLHDTAGSDLIFTAHRVEQVQEGPVLLRPRVTAGDGTTDLELWMAFVPAGRY